MAERLAIIGLISATVHLTETISTQIPHFIDAPKEADELQREVIAAGIVLGKLKSLLQQDGTAGNTALSGTSALFTSIEGCHGKLKEIQESLEISPSRKKILRVWGRVKWVKDRSNVLEAVNALHRYTQIFHFAISIDGITTLSLPQQDAFGRIQARLDSTGEQATETLALLQEVQTALGALPGLSNGIASIGNSVRRLTFDKKLSRILDFIKPLPYQDRHNYLQEFRTEGVGQWITTMPAFLNWRDGGSSRTLWCNGGPGAGKTYLTSVIIDHLEKFSQSPRRRVLYIYFDYKQQLEQTPHKILQTLLRQLLATFAELPLEAEDLHEAILGGKDLPGWADLRRLFIQLCQGRPEIFVVFDALDECDEYTNRKKVTELLQDIMQAGVYLLVTSRPYPEDIYDLLGDCRQVLVEASDADIKSYVENEIAQSVFLSKKVGEDVREQIVRSILEKSQGMFLLPALQMKTILGQTNRRQVLQALEKLPRGLSENLSFTMDRIKSQHAESDTKAQLALSVLMWLSTVKRPLSARELQQAVAVPPGGEEMDDLIDEMSFVDSCFGLVVIDPGTDIIRLVHFSVNEFLDARRHEFFPEADGTLALSCTSYILIQSPAFPTDGSDEVLDLFSIQQPFLEYASTYWGIHAATCFNLAVRCKVYELCQAQLASNVWTRVVQLKQKKMTSTDNKEWIAAAKYVAPGLSEVHLSAIYDIPDLGMDALKQKHRDINAPDSKMRTPLMIAAALGREELVELFLGDDNLDINAVDGDGPDGRPALWYAVESSNFAMVQKLCSSSHDIDINQGGSLATAVYSSGNPFNLEMIKFFLDHPRVDPNPYYEGKPHPTNTLARNFHITFLSQLIAMPDIDPWKWSSPLDDYQDHLNYITNTDYFGDNGSISAVPQGVRLLDSNPKFCYPDFQALDMMWPSVYFAYADTIPYKIDTDGSYQYQIGWMGIWDHTHGTWRTEVRERMESFGINFETTDSKGRTFVHSLARSGNVDFLRFLLDRGESVHRVDTSGRSPLHYAAEGEAEGCEETLQLLLDSGANPAAVDTNGWSVLHSACKRGNAKIVERLLGANADVNATDRQKRTPLHLASGLQNARLIISMLLDRGADIHARDFIGSTPLREATYIFESTDATLVLIERGANCDVISFCGPLISELLVARVGANIWRLILPKAKLDGVELDSFGMTTLDVLSQPHAIDTEDERLPNLLLQYTETTSDIRATHIRANMLNRLDCMLASDDRTRLTISYRTACQLLILGDQDSAQTLLDLWPVPFSKSGKPYIQDIVCVSCFTEIGPLFKCRTCPFVDLCKACHDKRPIKNGEPKVPFCEGHEFLQFPSDNWKTLPEGVVNSKGDTLDEFLMSLKLKYSDSNPDTCVIL